MGKKNNKYKSVTPQKSVSTETKKETETPSADEIKVVEPKRPDLKELSNEMAKKHIDQMSALSTMPLRLDHQIRSIKTLQQELFKLHLEQMTLLDGCTDFLLELDAVHPTNDLEMKIVLETFSEVRTKLSEVFEHFLPAQLDLLKHETKLLQISNQLLTK
ncbi:uncharacterized protein LOC108116295 isoform X2 [Drosophila eugracilis]|uniref:uncharacterized protein LOC108116295 isoform X2 n=1 Tax=Drosophila eugracilis TaxID=29029 RepID=UPI001BDA28DC|nr:uncharacterized protein LOC108116295 isoform X2 [Drosophila eugracilis]